MSVEAVDRVAAVTSSRPSTPLQTSWFEFLLDGSLLEKHLQKSNPDPTPVQLIVQFLEQASKPSVNEQNQVQPPADNRRNRTLKLLALKVAAHMKWDLDALEKGLTIPVLNMLLNELLCVSKVPPGVKHVDLDLSTLPPTTAMAVIIYNRWAIRTIVLSSFPEKQTKPGPHQMNMLSIVQQEKEMTENILSVLKEQATDSISVLEGALQLKKDFYVHTLRTLDLLAADAAANGETESSTAGLRISADELHCQVHYDLGGIFFQQGCTDQTAYEKARDHFRQTKELLAKLDSTVHVHLDEKRLAGYWNACKALTGDSDLSDTQNTPYNQINSLIRAQNYQAVIEAFIKDNVSRSLPNNFRRSVLREFLYKVQQGESSLDEVCYKLCVCNAVRDALEGEVLSVRFQQLLLKPSKRMVDFILEVCTLSLDKDRPSETSRRNMATFMKTLCETLEELSLLFVVSSHKLFMELLKEEERKVLVEQLRKRSFTINLSAKPLPSFYDIPASASVNIGQLEQQLILSLEPRRIRQILIELHGMAERPFWRVNSKWEVPPDYINVILGIKDNLTKDLVYILMAKGLHCISIKDFAHARQLFSACLELVTEFSPKLRQVMLNEMLLLEVRAHETMAAEGSKERPPPDLVSRVRGYLEMRIHDLPLRQVVGEECVAFMLNWRENDYLTLQVPPSLVMNNPYIKLGQLLASTCKELPGPKECRRTAKELWDVVVQICSVSIQHKRNNDGRVGLIKQRESSMGIMYRSKFITFIKKLREPLVLTTLISLFVRLHSIVRDDIVNEVTAEHLSIWPSTLPNIQAVDVEAVAVTVKELVSYALTLNPNNQSWLITQADIYFVTNQYSAALNLYLQAGAVCSDFFTKAVPPDVYTDQALKRMIKCCSMMNCHTQVAVLCQFLREVDYMTAFKALQEQNSHDAMDSFYDYIWDVTILEYLTHIHHKRGETEKRQIAIKAIGQTELNTSNPEEVLQLAAQKRKKRFLQAMAKLYFYVISGQTPYHCEYHPAFAKPYLRGSEQKWFYYLVKASYGFYVIQAASLPLGPPERFSYKFTMIRVPRPATAKTKPATVPTAETTSESSKVAVHGDVNFTGIVVAIFGGLVGLIILSSCYILYKRCGASFATLLGFKKLPTSPPIPIPVLVVYPAKNSAFQRAVVELAEFLQWHGGCSVAVDMWQQGKIAELGPMRWLAEQLKAAHRVLIVCPQPSSQPSHSPLNHTFPEPSIPAAAHDLYPLILNMVASHAKSASYLAKFWVVQLGEQQDKKPCNLAPQLGACKTFCLMKDLNKLCRSLHTQSQDGKKMSNLIFRPEIAYSEKCTVNIREAVEKLGGRQSSIFREGNH